MEMARLTSPELDYIIHAEWNWVNGKYYIARALPSFRSLNQQRIACRKMYSFLSTVVMPLLAKIWKRRMIFWSTVELAYSRYVLIVMIALAKSCTFQYRTDKLFKRNLAYQFRWRFKWRILFWVGLFLFFKASWSHVQNFRPWPWLIL